MLSSTPYLLLVLAHWTNLSCFATPTPVFGESSMGSFKGKEISNDPGDRGKRYMNLKTHHPGHYEAIHINKGKVGDNQVLQAIMADPHVDKVHVVLAGLEDADKAHANLYHYLGRQVDNPKPMLVYRAPNHLHEAEHHESVWDTQNEDGTPIETPRLLDFYQHLGQNLEPGKNVWVHSTAPTTLGHLDHIGSVTRENGNRLLPVSLSVGHNSQQYHPDPHQKSREEGVYLKGALSTLQQYHDNARINWSNSHSSFDEHPLGAVNRPTNMLKDILHPDVLKQGEKDIFYGPTIEKVHTDLIKFQNQGIIHPQIQIPDPHPEVYKKKGIPLRDAISDMRTTKDKRGKDLRLVKQGRKHIDAYLKEIPGYMRFALESDQLNEDDKRAMGKRLGRMSKQHFANVFKGENYNPVEFADPLALAAHRQAAHNKGKPTGPHYADITFRKGDFGWYGDKAGEGDEVHGQGLFGANADEALEDHKFQVKGGKELGYIETSRHHPVYHDGSASHNDSD